MEAYRFVNDALKTVSGAEMISHETLNEGLVRTTYSNGTAIYINYGDKPASADGKTVPAMNYLVAEGGGRP